MSTPIPELNLNQTSSATAELTAGAVNVGGLSINKSGVNWSLIGVLVAVVLVVLLVVVGLR